MTSNTLFSLKTGSFILIAAIVLSLLLPAMAAEKAAAPKKGKLRHVVAFKFKETATPTQIKEVEDAFRGLKKKIKQIADFEWGLNNSPEGLNKGFTHGFIITFKTEKDREEYLPHPEHKKFVELVGPLVADVFVIDFWAKD